MTVEQYTLEYAAPAAAGGAKLAEGIKVARFSVSQEQNSTDMLYEAGPGQRGVHEYHRWRANPADLVTDYLTRDLRSAGVFAAVLPWQAGSLLRFKLEGALEEFLARRGPGGPEAVLRVSVTLLDISQRETPQRLLYQRTYEERQFLADTGPAAQALALSQAMARASARIVEDARKAAAERLAKP